MELLRVITMRLVCFLTKTVLLIQPRKNVMRVKTKEGHFKILVCGECPTSVLLSWEIARL